MFRSYVWTYSVKGKPHHVRNKILSLPCHKFVHLWCLNVPCHEENILLHLSSWPSFITQENKVKLQTSFIAKLTVVVHWSFSAYLITLSLSIFLQFFLRSWDRVSLMYSSKTNTMRRCTIVFITINALLVSDGSSARHQELKTVYTASGICRAFSASYRYREWVVPTHSR